MSGTKQSRRAVLGGMAAAVAWCCADHGLDAAPPVVPADHDLDRFLSPDTDRVKVATGLAIHPRSDWGSDLAPKGALSSEEVKFLLVHHTASSNHVPDPRPIIRQVYGFHTGPAKRWPDVAYNFFVAPDGSVWEGRAGSLDRAIVADASGGNQGFSQLVCLIGNHSNVAPTAAAQDSLVRTLAWLADRHGLDTYADASTTFVSRGSDKFRAGSSITTPIVSAHRDVTFTACPGDAAVALLPTWRRRVFDTLSATWETDGLQRAERLQLRAP